MLVKSFNIFMLQWGIDVLMIANIKHLEQIKKQKKEKKIEI